MTAHKWPLCRRGFTLIELLVSMVVLVILVLAVAQMLSSASTLVAFGTRHMGADLQARLVFDRMAADLATMVNRKDVDCIFSMPGNNDSMFFFGEGPAYSVSGITSAQQSSVSLVGYRINTSTYKLERLGKALSWGGAPVGAAPGTVLFLIPDFSNAPLVDYRTTIAGNNNLATAVGSDPFASGIDAGYNVLADGVFRMEICYLLKGTLDSSNNFISGPAYSYSHTRPNPDPTSIYEVDPGADSANHSLADVAALVVTLAVLDDNSLKLAAPNIANLSQQFPDPQPGDLTATPPILMAQTWLSTLTSPGFAASAGVSPTVAAQVRIYQRTFYLNNYN